jgi:hypothetical protein
MAFLDRRVELLSGAQRGEAVGLELGRRDKALPRELLAALRFVVRLQLDLPLPEGPSSTMNSPRAISRSTLRNARTSTSPVR